MTAKKANNYKNEVKKAYERGYTLGWENAHRFPDVAGVSASASSGFKSGIDKVHKTQRYSNRYKNLKGL